MSISKRLGENSTLALLLVVSISIGLNLLTFILAYPEIFKIDHGCCAQVNLAKDFSAFYTSGWRLLHDPANVYTSGFLSDGENLISPQPEPFKYLPSFLIFIVPYLSLNYERALAAFDIVQFALLIPMAWLIYKLLEGKKPATIAIVLVVALLLPLPINGFGVFASYYWQWAEGQSKVLETFLIVLSLYLGKTNRSFASGIVFGLSFFDPRFGIIAIPLFLTCNKGNLRNAVLATVGTFFFSNTSLLYPAIGNGFIQMITSGALETPLYPYAYIPLLTVLALTFASRDEVFLTFKSVTPGRQKRAIKLESRPDDVIGPL